MNAYHAFEKGVLFGLGTDAGTPGNYHGKTANEIISMIENVGMTPIQALQTATIGSARAIKMDDEIGSIEVGKFADLVVCKENPLENMNLLQDPSNFACVIKDGKICVENGKLNYFN